MEEVTIFDKIVSGAIKANIVYEDDLVSQINISLVFSIS